MFYNERMARKWMLCLGLCLLGRLLPAQSIEPPLVFSFEEEKEAIRLYSAYDTQRGLLLIKGEVTVRTSPDKVLAFLQDSPRGHLWVNEVRQMETLAAWGDSVWISRAFIHFPFPWKDRVLVMKNIVKRESPAIFFVTQQVEATYYSGKSAYVPILNAYGQWSIQCKNQYISKITYIFGADVQVALPAYVEKKMAIAGMYGTLRRMRRILENKE
jgi:hypothetical protein